MPPTRTHSPVLALTLISTRYDDQQNYSNDLLGFSKTQKQTTFVAYKKIIRQTFATQTDRSALGLAVLLPLDQKTKRNKTNSNARHPANKHLGQSMGIQFKTGRHHHTGEYNDSEKRKKKHTGVHGLI